MTREEVITMAREAGLNDWMVFGRIEPEENILMRFAAAVAQREREACIKIIEELLEALEALAEQVAYRSGDNECRPLENALAAIKKARGKA